MDTQQIEQLLRQVRDGRLTVDSAVEQLRHMPFESLEFATVDHHRALRCGFAEVIFCAGKSGQQVLAIFEKLAAAGTNVLATRAEPEIFEIIKQRFDQAQYNDLARTIALRQKPARLSSGTIGIVSAGTSDLPVAEEARVTAEIMDQRTQSFYDVGVAGLHRLLAHNQALREMNVLLFSTDPVALDSVVCKMIDLDPNLVEPLVVGGEFGLGTMLNITIIGDAVEDFINPDFEVNRSPVPTTEGTSFISSDFMRRYSAPRPTINPEACTRCGTCVKVCPVEPKALSWANESHTDPPVYDYAKCIRCYCCQEMCPENAIYVKVPLLGKLIHR